MSNCVNITSEVAIPLDQITEPQMLAAHVHAASNREYSGFDEDGTMDMWWWFLTPDNCGFETDPDHGLVFVIQLGYGRSGHTWRDLRGTLHALSQYLVPDVYIPLELTDELDGHQEVVRVDAQPHTMKMYEPA